ncbi:MAG: xanthine dehydrogenase family protein subunit M [Hyphomicrobiales bacterium]|nr:xanthine dehydrogenase family protein subunit M [Hyphomicrobiales bacterium]
MYEFDYHRPGTLDAAVKLAGEADAKILAGGHTLIPTLKQRLAAPKLLVDLHAVRELQGVHLKDGQLVIGAMTTHAHVADSALVKAHLPGLAALAAGIGDPHVRHRGTIGGSVANNDPAADYPSAVLALNATIITNKRSIKADDFFKGMFETALAEGEIITHFSFPAGIKSGYAKFPNPASRYALVGVYVAQHGSDARVAVTGAGANGVFRASTLEAALKGNFSAAALEGKSVPADGINSDMHADAAYRAHLIGVMARRAVAAAH